MPCGPDSNSCLSGAGFDLVTVETRGAIAQWWRCKSCRRPWRRRNADGYTGPDATPLPIRLAAGLG